MACRCLSKEKQQNLFLLGILSLKDNKIQFGIMTRVGLGRVLNQFQTRFLDWLAGYR